MPVEAKEMRSFRSTRQRLVCCRHKYQSADTSYSGRPSCITSCRSHETEATTLQSPMAEPARACPSDDVPISQPEAALAGAPGELHHVQPS
jgi:hypothetical protein